MLIHLIYLVFFWFSACSHESQLGSKLPKLPSIQLQIDRKPFQVWYAKQSHEVALGLRYRHLASGQGIFFVPRGPRISMAKMRSPIDVALIDQNAVIFAIWQLKIGDSDRVLPKQTNYILEMSEGWFAHRKIKTGMSVMGIPIVEKGK